ncbi:MAG: division/cell wall cluster transcriptional repressor MraZ [Caldilineae bacterium]|nr:division/cell wall cluster transcriptional repressor MraZ [Chloroflexota bacterium]MCB9177716.1 division/cell wall cluster transcriptional repressor MraZ [Caldilineae bacterium]
MFFGESEHNLDDKGRVIIPIRHRPAFESGLFVTRGLESCLWIFTLATWREISERLADARMMSHDARQLERLLYSGSETNLDKQGRLLLPASLRGYAGIQDGEVAVLVGVKNRIEVWNRDRWLGLTAQLGQAGSDFTESLAELGI